MAFTVDLRNVSPRGDVSLYVDDQQHEVPADGILTVTPETAGEAPHWRRATEADENALKANPEALHWRIHAGAVEVYDLGSGLLAQTENWRPAGDDSDPAHPLADGRGGLIDPAEQAASLAEAQRAQQIQTANIDAETETE